MTSTSIGSRRTLGSLVAASAAQAATWSLDLAHASTVLNGPRSLPRPSADRGLGRAGPEPRAFRAGARRAGGKMFTNVPGGFPIEVGGEVIGAGAAGGAKIEQDVEVAKAALAVLKL